MRRHVEEEEPMLDESRENVEAQRVIEATAPAIEAYACCFRVHACLVEGPCAAVEALFWAQIYLAASCCGPSYLRESCLFCALALSPISCVYRDFNAQADEWHLRPAPTVLGWVDPRRLGVLMFGQAATACNLDDECMDSWPGAVLHAPVRTTAIIPMIPSPKADVASELLFEESC